MNALPIENSICLDCLLLIISQYEHDIEVISPMTEAKPDPLFKSEMLRVITGGTLSRHVSMCPYFRGLDYRGSTVHT